MGWRMVDFECFWKSLGLGLAGEGKASQQQVQKNSVRRKGVGH